jgi:hypothetical protein
LLNSLKGLPIQISITIKKTFYHILYRPNQLLIT